MDAYTNIYMIYNIRSAEGKLTVQINSQKDCFNLEFSTCNNKLALDGFALPNVNNYHLFSPCGDTYAATIKKVSAALPVLTNKYTELSDFLAGLAKRFKVTHAQLNINSHMDYAQATPYTVNSIVGLCVDLSKCEIPTTLY